jgi:hypothetical protein
MVIHVEVWTIRRVASVEDVTSAGIDYRAPNALRKARLKIDAAIAMG